jgi:hypothetical protein
MKNNLIADRVRDFVADGNSVRITSTIVSIAFTATETGKVNQSEKEDIIRIVSFLGYLQSGLSQNPVGSASELLERAFDQIEEILDMHKSSVPELVEESKSLEIINQINSFITVTREFKLKILKILES